MPGDRHSQQIADRRDVTPELIGDQDPWCAKPIDQPLQKPPGGLRIASLLNQDVENITIGINRSPQPVFLSANLHHNFVQMPFIGGNGPFAFYTARKMVVKAVHTLSNCLPADKNPAFSKKDLRRQRCSGQNGNKHKQRS